MTDKEALEHILSTADDIIKAFGNVPVDSIEHMTRHAGVQIVSMIKAVGLASNPKDQILMYATAIAGLIIRLKANLFASALLAAEEASDEST